MGNKGISPDTNQTIGGESSRCGKEKTPSAIGYGGGLLCGRRTLRGLLVGGASEPRDVGHPQPSQPTA